MSPDGPPGVSRRRVLALAGAGILAGCQTGSDTEETPTRTPLQVVEDDYRHPRPLDDPDWEVPTASPRTALEVETLVENLEVPWDIAFTGTGELYMTERVGRILRFDAGEVAAVIEPSDAIDAESIPASSEEQPWWVDGGEGGTLGVAVHPNYPDEQWVYVYYTADIDGGKENRVVRFDVSASDPASTEEVLIDGIPANAYHNGGRIRFGPDDNLWVCTGDAGQGETARDPATLPGKILRISPTGEALTSNPDLGGDRRVFTVGHRNPQGIDWLPSGVPIIDEHGPGGRDEVNLLLPGSDYGWNDVRVAPSNASEEYDAYPSHEDVVAPLLNTGPTSWAPTGATFYTGDDLPAWRNRYVMGGLISQSLWVVTLTPPGHDLPPTDGQAQRFDADWTHDAYTATAHRMLHNELGRVRHVAQSPSGELYAITSNRDGRAKGRFPRDTDPVDDVLVRLTSA
jgi:glucose/arabinose dehydrogenase